MDGGASVQDRKNPAKIGGRNSSFASLDLGVGVRLQGRALQPDALARSLAVGAIPELRAPIFAGFFHVRGGWVTDLTENGTSS